MVKRETTWRIVREYENGMLVRETEDVKETEREEEVFQLEPMVKTTPWFPYTQLTCGTVSGTLI
jgi:hypothetical protein